MTEDAPKQKRRVRHQAYSQNPRWYFIAKDLGYGKPPLRSELINSLRSGDPAPGIVCEFIADLLEKKRKFSKGREPDPTLKSRYFLIYSDVVAEVQKLDVWEKSEGRPGGVENANILSTVRRSMPNNLAASRRLIRLK